MFPFILFLSLTLYSLSYRRPGQFIAFFNHGVLCLFELFFKVGRARWRREREPFQLRPLLNLVPAPLPPLAEVGGCVLCEATFRPEWGGWRAARGLWPGMPPLEASLPQLPGRPWGE